MNELAALTNADLFTARDQAMDSMMEALRNGESIEDQDGDAYNFSKLVDLYSDEIDRRYDRQDERDGWDCDDYLDPGPDFGF